MLRSGSEYRNALRDGRQVILGGQAISDVTKHPSFSNSVDAVAELYDISSQKDESGKSRFAYQPNGSDESSACNIIFKRPRNQSDLTTRRSIHEAWAESTFGLLGRSPDHVAAFITGMACAPEAFDPADEGYGKHLVDYWTYVRARDLFLCYAIVPPGAPLDIDSLPGEVGSNPTAGSKVPSLRVVDSNDSGITVWGYRLLTTGAVLADEVLVGNVQRIKPEDTDQAVTFAIPISTEGLYFISRKPYTVSGTRLDEPLSSRFDETDAVLFADNVHVPWERVFTFNDIRAAGAIFDETPAQTLGNAQAHIRLREKLRLILGLTKRMLEANGVAAVPPVQDAMASLAVRVAVANALVISQEAVPEQWPGGFVSQNRQAMYATMAWTGEIYPDFIRDVRELLASHPLQLPADATAFDNELTSNLYSGLLGTDTVEASVTYYAIGRLLWDLVGTEFANRHTQYEMFYAGPGYVRRMRLGRFFDWERATAEADRCILETLPTEMARNVDFVDA